MGPRQRHTCRREEAMQRRRFVDHLGRIHGAGDRPVAPRFFRAVFGCPLRSQIPYYWVRNSLGN